MGDDRLAVLTNNRSVASRADSESVRWRPAPVALACAVLVALVAFFLAPTPVALGLDLTVNSEVDGHDGVHDGVCDAAPPGHICTLRAAIEEIEATADTDNTITFNIPTSGVAGGLHTLNLGALGNLNALNAATNVTIDAWSQGGPSYHGVPLVLLRPLTITTPPSGNGLTVQDTNVTIKGLAIGGFDRGIDSCGCSSSFKLVGSYLGVKRYRLDPMPQALCRTPSGSFWVPALARRSAGPTPARATSSRRTSPPASGSKPELASRCSGISIGTDRTGSTSLGNDVGIAIGGPAAYCRSAMARTPAVT